MKTIVFIAFLLGALSGLSQQAEVLGFNEKIHDFGTIREDAGPATFEFMFQNSSGRTITILSVQASCGCTTPGWTKEPVPNGQSGFIQVSYNPVGRPGYFNKTLTVKTNLNDTPIVLQIKGSVTNEKIENDPTRLAQSNGHLNFKSNAINFGKVFINKTSVSQDIVLFNAGDVPMTITSAISPDYIQVSTPLTIPSHQQASLKINYDGSVKNQYGFASDKIELVTDDEGSTQKIFSVYATVEEYFPSLTAEESINAPVLQLSENQIDLGHVRTGSSIKREVRIRNVGKEDVVIRAIQPNCNCIEAKIDGMKVSPGREGKLIIQLKGEGRKGTHNKAVTLYTNDPAHPVQRVAITVVVD